jgi:hypothetical protein
MVQERFEGIRRDAPWKSDQSFDSDSTDRIAGAGGEDGGRGDGRRHKFLSTKLLRKRLWTNARSLGQEYDDEVYGRYEMWDVRGRR